MFSAFEWMVAARYLRPRRQQGFVSVIAGFSCLGVFFGVAALIIVMAVMNGFRHELLGRILGVNGHVTVYGFGGRLEDFDALADELRAIDGVVWATPLVDGQVLASSSRGASTGAIVRGLRADDLAGRKVIAETITAGALEKFAEGDAVIIGSRLGERLGLGPGDKITLLSPQGMPTAFGTMPRSRAYDIAGTFNVGMYEYDNAFIFMPFAAAQLYFRMGAAVSGI